MKNSQRLLLLTISLLSCVGVHHAYAQGGKAFISTRLSFGSVVDGKSSVLPLIINNSLDSLALHGRLSKPSNAVFSVIGPDTFSVAPKAIDTILIQFSPVGVNTFADTIEITHDAAMSRFLPNPLKVVLTGQGLPVGDTTARLTTSLGVGASGVRQIRWNNPIDTAVKKSMVIRNVSDTAIRRLYGRVTGLHAPFSLPSGASTFDLADSASDTLAFTFMAADSGVFLDTIQILSNANHPDDSLTILLQATATKPVEIPQVFLGVTSIDFGTVAVGHDSSSSVLVTNVSKAAPLLIQVEHKPVPPFSLTVLTGSIESGTSDTVHVTYLPFAPGSQMDSVVLSTNAQAPYARIRILLSGMAPQARVEEDVRHGGLILTGIDDPTNNRVLVHFAVANAQSVRVQLFDALGNTVGSVYSGIARSVGDDIVFSTIGLPNGLYFLRMDTDTESLVTKVPIAR